MRLKSAPKDIIDGIPAITSSAASATSTAKKKTASSRNNYAETSNLDFSKIQAGKLALESVPFNLKKLVHQVGRLFRSQAENKRIDL